MGDKVQHIYSEQRRITSETSKKKGVYLAARGGNYFVAAHETQVFILHLNVAYEPKNDFFDMFFVEPPPAQKEERCIAVENVQKNASVQIVSENAAKKIGGHQPRRRGSTARER